VKIVWDFYKYLFYNALLFVEKHPKVFRQTFSNNHRSQIILGLLFFLLILFVSELKSFQLIHRNYFITLTVIVILINIGLFGKVKNSAEMSMWFNSFSNLKKIIFRICYYVLWIISFLPFIRYIISKVFSY